MNTHTVHPLCLLHMLHFSPHTFKIICHLAFLTPGLSVVFCWLFNRKQRQRPLGRRWKTTTRLCTQLSTNVLFISSLPLKRHGSRFVAVLLMSACYRAPSWHKANSDPDPPIFIYFVQQQLKRTSALLPVQWDLSQRAPHSDQDNPRELGGNRLNQGKHCGSWLDSPSLSPFGREDPYQWQGAKA